jgi:hypothetical protein
LLLRKITLWTIGIDKNHLSFNKTKQKWVVRKVQQTIWQGLFEYARIDWAETLKDATRAAIYDKTLFHGMHLAHTPFHGMHPPNPS